ncbi:MAG: ATP-binding protein [Thioalkalispiraceae bacterium]|jgi:PAS domain S-box-containing protein
MKPSTTSSFDDRVYLEQVRLLFAALPFSLLATIFNASLLCVVLWVVLPEQLLIGWYLLVLMISLARYINFRLFNKQVSQLSVNTTSSWEMSFLLGAGLSALLWGLIPVFLFPKDLAYQAIIAFVIGGMAAGAVTSLSFRLTAVRLYLFIVVTPLIVRLLSGASYISIVMGIMASMFLALLLVTTRRLYQNTEQNILLRMRSDEKEDALQKNIQALQCFHTITSDTDSTFDNKLEQLLQLGLETFRLDIAIISHINHGIYTIEHIVGPEGCPGAGTRFNFDDTYCSQTFLADAPRGFHHVGQSTLARHPCYETFKLEAYIGAPIWVNDSRYGTLNFSSSRPRNEPFSEHELSLMQLFAQWIGNEIARTESERKLTQFKSTLDMISDCVFMFDPASLRFFYVNQGAVEQVGYSKQELLCMTPFDLKPEFDAASFSALIKPLETGEQSQLQFETLHQHKNGSLVPVEISLQYVTPPDASPRYVTLARDITERKRIDELKSGFISTVSHELRTPLTSIRGALGLLVSGAVGEKTPDKMQSMLEIADNNTKRLLILINDILDLQKIESGNMSFHFDTLEVMPFIEQAIKENNGYAQVHDVTIKLVEQLDHGYIYADKARLMQVMNNLISNAAKFSPRGSQIEIGVSRVAGNIRITVTDHGAGIPEEFHNELFQRFRQYDSSDTRRVGGTGLGLSISKMIVEKHHGQIGFTSSPGQGSSFYFELQDYTPTTAQKITSDL